MAGMFTAEDLKDFPKDRELAFLQFERLARARLDDDLQRADGNYERERAEFDYTSSVLAAAQEYEIHDLSDRALPNVNSDDLWSECRQFRAAAEHITVKLLIRQSRRVSTYSVAFDAAAKTKLHHFLDQVRELVEKLEISATKKDRLLKKVNALRWEVDRERTPYEAFADLMIEAADDVGETARRLEPVVQLVERIGAAFGKSKRAEDAEEQRRLPAPTKRIEGRKTPKPQSRGFDVQLDDEIPF